MVLAPSFGLNYVVSWEKILIYFLNVSRVTTIGWEDLKSKSLHKEDETIPQSSRTLDVF